MTSQLFAKRIAVAAIAATMWILPVAAIAQTQIVAPKNKYKVQDDIKLGTQAASEIERQFPIINDSDANAYLERVGSRLVAAIPRQFDQPAFDYRFKWVNASDINAFALPGGPMYVNRGMVEKARNEGEMAGVMAHEISHVALRHATAQATEQSGLGKQLGMLGMIVGGAILGGEAGAQLGMLGAAAWMTKYSRKYESQADMLGARIMADAGYDPRDLANVFRTIQGESKGGGPEWLSSHPDPGNRFEKINKEAQYLSVASNPIKITRDFSRIQERFHSMPPARTMAQIEKDAERTGGQGNQYPAPSGQDPAASGQYTTTVQFPSARIRSYSGLDWIRINVPSNWREFPSQDSAQFAPAGAYGDQGITRGVMLGVYQSQAAGLDNATATYIYEILKGNSYLRQRGAPIQTSVARREGYTATLSGRSPVTNRSELVTVYTTLMRNGELFYFVTVVPENESYSYNTAFRNMLNSIRLID